MQSQVVVLGPDKRGITHEKSFWLEEEIMRSVESNESDRGSKTKQTNKLTSKTKIM